MDSNHQWQKQQTNDRIQRRMREAETRRLLKSGSQKDTRSHGTSFLARVWAWLRKTPDLERSSADNTHTPRRSVRRTAD